MYEAFFNLKNKPFSLLPDPEFLFLSSRHAIGLSLLEYSLSGQAGFCVITGEIGSGKTTLVRAFLGRVGRDFTVGLISNTHHALKDIAAWAMASFGQKPTGNHPSETYQQLMEYLIAEYGAGRQCILIVDEAQNLSIEVLEELRLLSNINSGKDLLLQVVLVGQPELLEKLKRPELSQFAQRIAVSHHLTPLPYPETRRYIEHRVKVAGSDRPLFTEMAMGAIQYFSGGIPRLINSICDMALVYGFADEQPVIGEELVFRVVSDRQLSGIAPFAQSLPADDPTVRAEIMKLANLGASMAAEAAADASPAPAESTTPPETAETAAAEPSPAPAGRLRGKSTPVVARQTAPQEVATQVDTQQVLLKETPSRQTHIQEAPSRQAAMRRAPASEGARANPYFFREAEDDEELLLISEMKDSPRNAHNLVAAAQAATPFASPQDRVEPRLEAPRPADIDAAHSPNQTHAAEEDARMIVDPMPWPSVSDRRLGAPIPAKEHGTEAPRRRSWWRRSIGRS